MITVDDYLWGWKAKHPNCSGECSDDTLRNAQITVDRANQLFVEFGSDRAINSGWRPAEVNREIGGAAHSKHLTGCAIDLADPGGVLDGWITGNPDILDELDLWRESPDKTPGWVHLQIEPYASWQPGKTRTFAP